MTCVYECRQKGYAHPVYYGISETPELRWASHFSGRKKATTFFGKAIAHFGKDAFTFSVIERHDDRRGAQKAETDLIIAAYKAKHPIYNAQPLPALMLGRHLVEVAPDLAIIVGADKRSGKNTIRLEEVRSFKKTAFGFSVYSTAPEVVFLRNQIRELTQERDAWRDHCCALLGVSEEKCA